MSKYLARVNALLAQSEAAATEEEAATYLAKAQELIQLHGLSMANVREAQQHRDKAAQPIVRRVVLTENRRQKFRNRSVELFNGIANQNDVRITIYHGDCQVDAYGFAEDIDAVETLFASLHTQMVEAANKSIAAGEHKGHHYRVNDWNSDHYGDYRQINATMWRGSFYDGFIRRISLRLALARREAEARAKQLQAEDEKLFAELMADALDESDAHLPAENAPAVREVGLVLASKREKVNDHYKAATGHIRGSWKGGGYAKSSAGSNAGRQAGDRARLGTEKAISNRAAIGA